jgi:hypothetical protein
MSDAGGDRTSGSEGGDAPAPTRHVFRRVRLSTEFVCEGATYADFDGDLDVDVAFGPRWYEGPSFTIEHEVYAP